MIRSQLTRRFLTPDGAWTKDISVALDFSNIREVLAARQQFDLKDVELLLMIGNAPSQYDVTIPLSRDGK